MYNRRIGITDLLRLRIECINKCNFYLKYIQREHAVIIGRLYKYTLL